MTTYYTENDRITPLALVDSEELALPILNGTDTDAEPIKPTPTLKRLMRACFEVLMAGVTYQDDFKAEVAKKLDDIKPPEGFPNSFDMDVYYMRKAVESRMKLKANREALAVLKKKHGFEVEREWQGKIRLGGNNYSRVRIEELNDDEGVIVFYCTKRGSKKRWLCTIPANSSVLLSQLDIGGVTDDVVKKTESDHPALTSYIIEPSANVQKELVCQLS